MTEPVTRDTSEDMTRHDVTSSPAPNGANGSNGSIGPTARQDAPSGATVEHRPVDLEALYHALNGGGVRVVGRGSKVAGLVPAANGAKANPGDGRGRTPAIAPDARRVRATPPRPPRPRGALVETTRRHRTGGRHAVHLHGREAAEARRTRRTTVSWRQALAAGLVCFAVWLVLDAPTLFRSAEAGPLGARRTVAMTVLRPIADLSRALGVSHVVGAADRAIGRHGNGGLLQEEGPPVHRQASRSAGSAARAANAAPRPFFAFTPVTAPDGLRPLAPPSAAAPLQVLAVGDSLGIDFGQSLVNDLAATGVVHAVLDGHIDTGLSRPDYFDWQAQLQTDLARYQPQAVVVFIGANDPQNFIEGGSALAYGSQAWSDAYARRVGAFMQAATSAHARVLWVGMPPMSDPVLNGKMQVLNGIYQAEASAHPGVTYFPSWTVLSGAEGGYAAFLPDTSGNEVQVREPDGTHISPAGAQRMSRAAVAGMDHAWGLNL